MNLSKRETQVMTLVREGYTNKKIADALSIEEGTVKRHIHNIFVKLDVKNRVQAINKLYSFG